jgi:hypothetical protein
MKTKKTQMKSLRLCVEHQKPLNPTPLIGKDSLDGYS